MKQQFGTLGRMNGHHDSRGFGGSSTMLAESGYPGKDINRFNFRLRHRVNKIIVKIIRISIYIKYLKLLQKREEY